MLDSSLTAETGLPIVPIGHVRSCYSEKFGAPRQPGLIPSARGIIVIEAPYHNPQAFAELEQFSHVWVIFIFHQARRESWSPTVRPPRLGGNRRIGVFASRSPFRPNTIGMSPLKLEQVEFQDQATLLHVSGLDLVDGTPVIDIKPYIPYVDAIPDATGGYAGQAPDASLEVCFTETARQACNQFEPRYPKLGQLIRETLAADPRPAYLSHRSEPDEERIFGVRLYDLNVRWKVKGGTAWVVEIAE